jgi:hypothetical protein
MQKFAAELNQTKTNKQTNKQTNKIQFIFAYLCVVAKKVAEIGIAADFKRCMKPFDSAAAIVEEIDIVADVQLVIPECHSPARISTFHLLHELDELVTMLADFSRKVLRDVNVAAL